MYNTGLSAIKETNKYIIHDLTSQGVYSLAGRNKAHKGLDNTSYHSKKCQEAVHY